MDLDPLADKARAFGVRDHDRVAAAQFLDRVLEVGDHLFAGSVLADPCPAISWQDQRGDSACRALATPENSARVQRLGHCWVVRTGTGWCSVKNPATGELFTGGTWFAAQLNGAPIAPHPGSSLTDGLTYLGASPRVRPEQVVPVLDRLLRAGGMFVRGGSGALGLCDVACGRLLGYVEAHINSWDCLGAVAVLRASGCRVNDYLAGDALLSGNRIVAGPPAVYDQLAALLG